MTKGVIVDTRGARQIVEGGSLPSDPVQKARVKRLRRDRLLAESDWTDLPNAPLTDEQKSEWAAYRQALRDMPSDDGWPHDIAFPEQP